MTELLTQLESLLGRWLYALDPYRAGSPTSEVVRTMSFRPMIHHVVVEPFYRDAVNMDFAKRKPYVYSETDFVQASCAMEILVLALRLEPRVWGLLKTRGHNLINLNHHNLEELGAGIAIEWHPAYVDPVVAPLFARAGGVHATYNKNTARTVDKYEETKHRLHELDTRGRLVGFQIPLTLAFRKYPANRHFEQIHAFLTAIIATTNVETSTHNRSTGAVYRLVEVEVPRCVGSVDALKEIAALGIDILSCGVNCDDENTQPLVEELLRPDSTKPPIRLGIRNLSTETLPVLHTALGLGGRLDTLEVDFCSYDPTDFGLLAQVLRTTKRTSHSLRRLEVRCPELVDEVFDAMEDALATLSRNQCHRLQTKAVTVSELKESEACEPRNESAIGDDERLEEAAPSWQLESLIVRAQAGVETADDARRIVTALTRSIPPSLKSLHLDSDPVDAECLRLVLESFPHLEMLAMMATDMQPLLDAFSRGECKVQRLMLDGDDLGGKMQVIEALADPATRLAKTMTELVLIFNGFEPTFVSALETMLRMNSVLEYVDIRHITVETATRLDAFNGSLLHVPVPSRVASAFASVVASQPTSSALGSLDSVLIATIQAFSASTKCRLVVTKPCASNIPWRDRCRCPGVDGAL